jgi:O-antigen/teichoic acid export membrane protein
VGAVLGAGRDRDLVSFSWPQGLTETLNFLLGRIDVIMIAAFFPERPELVAFYGMAALIAGTVKKVRFAFDNSFSPVFAELHGRGDTEGLRREYRRIGRWIFSLFVLAGGAVALGSQFILMIYGDSFTEYWLAVPILVAGRLFNAAGGTAQTALLMSGRSRLELVNNLLINAGNIALNLVLIPRYHVLGAALATSTALTVFNLVRLLEVALLLKLWVRLASALRIAVAGLLAAAPGVALLVARGVSPLESLGVALVFVALYPAFLFLLGERADIRAARATLATWMRRGVGGGGKEGSR